MALKMFFTRCSCMEAYESLLLLQSICVLDCSPKKFKIEYTYPSMKEDYLGLMIQIKRYNINISHIALKACLFLLGLTPVSPLLSITNLIYDTNSAVRVLTDKEKILLSFLKEMSNNVETEISISSIYNCFLNTNNNQDTINSILDSLADKKTIEIRTKNIRILK